MRHCIADCSFASLWNSRPWILGVNHWMDWGSPHDSFPNWTPDIPEAFVDHQYRNVYSFPLTTLLISSTIISSGQSAQLCFQQMIRSHFFASCRCSLKFALYISNSAFTSCHRPGSTSILALQSGYFACANSMTNPSL